MSMPENNPFAFLVFFLYFILQINNGSGLNQVDEHDVPFRNEIELKVAWRYFLLREMIPQPH
jgi:hypothetical protein